MRFGRVVVLVLLPGACGSEALPRPPTAAHVPADYREVPYPPPAAMVEVVPPPPEQAREVVWVDGSWIWRVGSFTWDRGGWVAPPAGARLQLWSVVFLPDGRVLFAPNMWQAENGARLDPPENLRPANAPPTELTGEHAAPP